ncbi:hypothetical protein ACWD7Y_04685 [Streptomyces drozdowiczii]
MHHRKLRRAAARRAVKVDMPRDVLKANGTQVKNYLETLRTRRYGMTDSAFAFGYRAVLRSRRATRQTVEDRMSELRHPVYAGGFDGR